MVDVFEGGREIPLRAETGTGIRMADLDQQRGSDTVTGYVSQTDNHFAVRECLPVKVVSAGIVRGLVPAGDLETCNGGRILRQESLLNGACDLQIVLHSLQL